jgi:hypothetical protein
MDGSKLDRKYTLPLFDALFGCPKKQHFGHSLENIESDLFERKRFHF